MKLDPTLHPIGVLPNNEMQRTRHGQNGASPLISVLGRHVERVTMRHQRHEGPARWVDLVTTRISPILLALALIASPLFGATESAKSPRETPPVPVKQARPKYPKAAYEQRIEGTVLVEFAIDAKGGVTDLRVVESVPALDAAALECARKWRFKPATRDGVPVATKAALPVVFRLR